MGFRDRFRKLIPKKKVEPTFAEERYKRQARYFERLGTPDVRAEAIQKRIKERKER